MTDKPEQGLEAERELASGDLQFERHGRIGVLTINRPRKLNTMTIEMGRAVRDLVHEVDADDSIAALVVAGAGEKAFCAGSDISVLDSFGTRWQMRNRDNDYALDLLGMRKPLIAAIRGYCYGGGLEIALASDIRVATAESTFACGEVKLGWIGGSGNAQLLTRTLGPGNAARLLLTGDPIDGNEAHRIGLIQELVEPDTVLDRALDYANRIAKNPPIAVQLTKHSIRMTMSTSLEAGLAYDNDLFTLCMMTEDSAEGIKAFLEKREPHFRGR
ncbi:MAG: enoyl-CoA hydratase/isomerase family protein [Gaiellales bacterium]